MSPRICQFCGAEQPGEGRFCVSCGKEVVARFCQFCGAQLPGAGRFCMSCGGEIVPASQHARAQFTPSVTQLRQAVPQPTARLEAQKPAPAKKKGHPVLTILVILFLIAGVSIVFFGMNIEPTPPTPTAVSAAQNAALWNNAHTALYKFVGDGMKTFGQDNSAPFTQQQLSLMSAYINDFSNALKSLSMVIPPPEQAITHRALLPIYQEILPHMTAIRDLLSKDPSQADQKWNKLAGLLDQTSGLMAVLSP